MSILEEVRNASGVKKHKKTILSVMLSIFESSKAFGFQTKIGNLENEIKSQIESLLIEYSSREEELINYIETNEPLLRSKIKTLKYDKMHVPYEGKKRGHNYYFNPHNSSYPIKIHFDISFNVPFNSISKYYEIEYISTKIQTYLINNVKEKKFVRKDGSVLSLGEYMSRDNINFSHLLVDHDISEGQVIVYETKKRRKKEIAGYPPELNIEFQLHYISEKMMNVSKIITFNATDQSKVVHYLNFKHYNTKINPNTAAEMVKKASFDPSQYKDLLYVTAAGKNDIDKKMLEIAYRSRVINLYNISPSGIYLD